MLLASALIAAGCGGDDDGDTTTTTTGVTGTTGNAEAPTKQEFIKQADEICTEGSQELTTALSEELGTEQPSDEEIEQFVSDSVVPVLREQFAELRALTPPEGDEEEVDRVFTAAEDAVDELEEDPGLVVESGSFEEADRLARNYGFKTCGGG
jgi:hypothetical protein